MTDPLQMILRHLQHVMMTSLVSESHRVHVQAPHVPPLQYALEIMISHVTMIGLALTPCLLSTLSLVFMVRVLSLP